MTPLCRCLRILARKRQQYRQAAPECREPAASATPQQLLARLLVLSASPFEGEGRGVAALLPLNALRPEMYGDGAEQWWMEIPAMVQYLDGHSKFSLDQTTWEHKLLEFLQNTLGRSKESGWSQDVSQELGRQMGSYANASVEKAFLYKALGTALAMSKDVASVPGQLRKLLRMADCLTGAERECLGSCLQLCARDQLDATLRALSDFEEEMVEGEDSWHLRKDLTPRDRDRVKSALLLFYSSAAAQAPPQQLLPQLADKIVPKILHHYSTGSQDTALTLHFIESISAVSLAVQRSGESQPHQLPHKQVLLSQLLEIIKAEPPSSLLSPVHQKAMVTIGHLSKAKQPLSCEKNQELMEQCLDSVFSLPPQEFTEDVGPIQTLYASTMATLEGLMQTLLEGDEMPERLQGTFWLLQRWLVSEQVWEHARAMRVSTQLLKAYLQTVTITTQFPPGQFSSLAGTLGPYTCDSLGSIRQGAGDAVGCLLDIQVVEQPWTLWGQDKQRALRRVCQELQSAAPEEVWDASVKLAKMVIRALPKAEILPFTQTLLESLGAVSQACDQASALWFHRLLTDRASDLKDTVQAILSITSLLEDPRSFPEGVSLLARALVQVGEAPLDRILQLLSPSLSSPCEDWRVTGTAFYAELMSHPMLQQRKLLKPVLKHLVAGAGDESDTIRRLGNMAQGVPQKVKTHRQLLLDTLRHPLAEPSSPQVVGESLRALTKTLGQLSDVGRLSQPMATQARAHFPHACCAAFQACAPLLGLTGLEGAFDSGLLTGASGERHRHLMGHVCKQLAHKAPALLESLVTETSLHLHSCWEGIRLAAAKLAGILAENMEAQHVQQLDLGKLLWSLRALHGDPSTAVKIAAAESISTMSQKQQEALQETGPKHTAPRG
ncbi:maestro heat-like repeat-containing protein family member 2A [Mauremys reevesii]|uniref:maestro heat-like repeat-containing protein family member 2A n=1 Tax=Mauremys reevesii TaxID=260615 RepID=UPI001940126D|nr:maestro heat-like repeat-containing protein family member 2A [Mauremys reevesii]